MPLDVGIVGLAGAGKTTLFNALTGARAGPAGKHAPGVAAVRDERLEQVAALTGSRKVTHATLRVHDSAGTDAASLGELRKADALLAVLAAFYDGTDPGADLETLRLELLVADRDHVERRLERVRTQAKSGERALREEVERLERLLAHVDAGGSPLDFGEPLPAELEPLTTKPLVVVENGGDAIDLKLEEELSELDPEEAAGFREGGSALEAVVEGLTKGLNLISAFTADAKEARTILLPRGATALDAAAAVHSDIARGFIRAEVIGWSDLVECGSRAEAARRGLQRLEGKDYVVADGDVFWIRFNV